MHVVATILSMVLRGHITLATLACAHAGIQRMEGETGRRSEHVGGHNHPRLPQHAAHLPLVPGLDGVYVHRQDAFNRVTVYAHQWLDIIGTTACDSSALAFITR